MDDLLTTAHGVTVLKMCGNTENCLCRIRLRKHLCLGELCSRGGRKLADLKESLFGIVMNEHQFCRVLYFYCTK